MALDAFPGTPGGDAHLLVVVAGAAAGRDGVAEPEAVFTRHPVCDIGEARRALVGGAHDAGVFVLVLNAFWWRSDDRCVWQEGVRTGRCWRSRYEKIKNIKYFICV